MLMNHRAIYETTFSSYILKMNNRNSSCIIIKYFPPFDFAVKKVVYYFRYHTLQIMIAFLLVNNIIDIEILMLNLTKSD